MQQLVATCYDQVKRLGGTVILPIGALDGATR
jgi:hypothetical protein